MNKLVASGDVAGAETASNKAHNYSIWAYSIGAICIVLALGGAYFVWSGTQAPLKVSNEELAAIQDGNTSSAYELTSSAFRASTSETSYSSFVQTHKVMSLKNLVPFYSSVDTSAGTASFEYRSALEGANYIVRTDLTRNGDKWEILSLDVKSE